MRDLKRADRLINDNSAWNRSLSTECATALISFRYPSNIDIIFVKLFSFFSETAYYMYVLMHIKKKRHSFDTLKKSTRNLSFAVIVGRCNRWKQLSRRTFACSFLNIYLDELRGGVFLCENLVTEQSKNSRIMLHQRTLRIYSRAGILRFLWCTLMQGILD